MPQNDSNTSTELVAQSPFDAVMYVAADGSERWSARDMVDLMGYSNWQNLETPLQRAMRAAENTGYDTSDQFRRSHNLVKLPQGGSNTRIDYELTRFAAYLLAMNGDPNKPEVAAAQAYFAVRTHEAETTRQTIDNRAVDVAVSQNSELIALMTTLAAQNGEMQRALIEIATAKAARVSPIAVSPLVPEKLTTVTTKPVLEADVPTGELIDYSLYTASGWLREVMGMDTVNWEYKKALGARAGKLARMRRLALVETAQSHFGKANKWPGWLWNDAYAEVGSVDAYVHELESRRQ